MAKGPVAEAQEGRQLEGGSGEDSSGSGFCLDLELGEAHWKTDPGYFLFGQGDQQQLTDQVESCSQGLGQDSSKPIFERGAAL